MRARRRGRALLYRFPPSSLPLLFPGRQDEAKLGCQGCWLVIVYMTCKGEKNSCLAGQRELTFRFQHVSQLEYSYSRPVECISRWRHVFEAQGGEGEDKGKPCLHTATASECCTVRVERGREGGSLGIRERGRERGNRKALVGAILLHSTSAKWEGGSSRCLQSCNSSGTLGLAQA